MPRTSLLNYSLVLCLGVGLGLLLGSADESAGTAPRSRIAQALADAPYPTTFRRDQPGDSRLHWADGSVGVSHGHIAFSGRMSVPASAGPRSTLYLSSDAINRREDFLHAQPRARRVGVLKPQGQFLVTVPQDINVDDYTTVVLWSESDQQLIATARYRSAWEDEDPDDL